MQVYSSSRVARMKFRDPELAPLYSRLPERLIRGFPKITLFGSPYNKDHSRLGSFWGPPIDGNLHLDLKLLAGLVGGQT